MIKIKNKIKRNWIITMPIASAMASFILSFWLKIILTPEAYGDFAIALFTVNILLGLGAVGYDQVIIRLSQITQYGLEVDRLIIIIGFIVILITPGVTFAVLNALSLVSELGVVYFLLSWSAALITVTALLFNLQGRLIESYLFAGTWKVILLIMVAVLYLGNWPIDEFATIILLSLSVTFFWLMIFRKKIILIKNRNISLATVVALYISSIISLVSYKLFDGLDRFLLISNFDKILFGDYFFVFNFILAPTSILVSYYSVKRMKVYKEGLYYKLVFFDYLKAMAITSVVTIILVIILYSFSGVTALGYESINSVSLIFIGALCATRNGYVILSTAYRVVASKMSLFATALFFGIISLFLYYGVENSTYDFNIQSIILIVLLMWITRTAFYFFIIKLDLKKLQKNGGVA